MINKVVGYGGFKSYQEHHYPTKKQGKQLQESNQVWQATKRDADKVNTLNNFNHYHSTYKKTHVENTQPQDYHPQHVVKGAHSTLNFKSSSLSKAYDKAEQEKAGQPSYRQGHNMLKTGTQHWKTNYQAEIAPSATASMSKTMGGFTNTNQSKFSAMRSQSTGKNLTKNMVNEELNKAQSYKNRAYINDAKTGTTDYKFNFGQKIGSHPLQLLSHEGTKQPVRDHPLKHGTNQLWTEIPGYQGFKPSELHFEQLKSKMQDRKYKDRGSQKLNLVENYQVNVPGYAGYKPKYNIAANQLRDSCFSSK